MKTLYFPLAVAGVFAATLFGDCTAKAATRSSMPVMNADPVDARDYDYGRIEFRDRPEADMLRRAYRILATGNHDYGGHRVKAMEAVANAGRLLGMDLHGDREGSTPQELSDDKLREARDLIRRVQGAAEVKDQRRIFKRLDEAAEQIDRALRHE